MPGGAVDPPLLAVMSVPAVVLATFFVDGLGDPSDQALRHVIPAVVGDDQPELRFELDRPAAGCAVDQVLGDPQPAFLGELPVEEVVQLMYRLVTVHGLAKEGVSIPACVYTLTHSRTSSFDRSTCRTANEATRGRHLVQRLLERPSSPVDPAHHRADRHVGDFRDLLV